MNHRELTEEETAVVREYAERYGHDWKTALRTAWIQASEPGVLQALRNSHGPTWLDTYRLPDRPGAVPGITVKGDGGVVIEGRPAVDFARLLVLKSAVKLEIVGMKRRGRSAVSIVKSEFGIKGSKEKVLEWLEKYIESERVRMNQEVE